MIELLVNIFLSVALLLCRNITLNWFSGFCAGTAVSILVNLYLS